MPTKVFGMPAHVLLVHAVVVLVPLTCLALVLHAVWPAARSRLGIVTPILALVSLVLVPITTNAGKYLRDHQTVGGEIAAKIAKHEHLGSQLLYYAVPLFLVAVAVWALGRYRDGAVVPGVAAERTAAREVPAWLSMGAAVVAIALAIATTIQLYRIGDSGAHAVWDGILH
ncbi:MAG: hypothetical protein QOI15_2743 [Pseudonocardiales bacterium]|nr:hypothetical protein [Pseudonocardiales bacterium]